MIRRFLILLLSLLPAFSAAGQQQSMPVTWDYAGSSFAEFAGRAEKSLPVRFYFRSEWVDGMQMPDLGRTPQLKEVLDAAFAGRNLHYHSDDRGNIIITGEYSVRPFGVVSAPQGRSLPQKDYSSEQTITVSGENQVYDIGNPSEAGRSGIITVSGYVRDISSGEGLPGVTVFVNELAQGTATDGNGFYMVNIPRGAYTMHFSFLGMKEASVSTRVYGSGRLDIGMAETYIPIEGAVVTARKNDALRRLETGLEKISIATLRLMPASLGETDVLKNILLVPGVKTVGEASQGFNVRGGASDQNLILLYGAPLFNPSHFFGFFTSVNADVIEDLHLYKGGMPARYGGRLSSVIDIIPRDGSTGEFSGKAGISPIATHILLDIPVVRDRLSAIVAARTTYSNWIMDLVDYPLLNKSRASFHDINSRVTWTPDRKNSIELSGYNSFDAFSLNNDTTYRYSNTIGSLKWNRSLAGGARLSVSASTSLYDYNIGSTDFPEKAFDLSYGIHYTGFRAEADIPAGEVHHLNVGIESALYNVMPGKLQPAGEYSLVSPKETGSQRALENALYLEDRLTLSESLSASLGIRYSVFSAIGPASVRLYEKGLPMSNATVTDTLLFGQGKFYRTYSGPEVRLSLNYMITGRSSIKVNYNRTRQYLHLLSNTVSISPTDIWKLSDWYLKPQVADQFSAGYYLNIPWNNIDLSAEIYYKPMRGMIDFKGGAVIMMNESIEKENISVTGRAWGAELMARKAAGNITWSLGYTYSRIMLRSISPHESEAINSGNWFPASFDRPHDLSVSFNYTVTRRFNFSFNYVYTTGRPVTYPVGTYQSGGLWLIHYSDRNKYRVPDYSRLDISARLLGNLRSKKLMNPSWTFSCYNLLGRANVYSEYFIPDGRNIRAYRLSVFARAIPSLSYSFDF